MKTCNKCKQEKEETEFNKHSKNLKTGLSAWCKICVRESSKKGYLIHKNKYQNNQRKIRDERREWLLELKKDLKCSKCEENHPAVLEFHHLDPKEKEFTIARVLNWKSKEIILKEIKKCIVLCSNCHKKVHWRETKY